MSRTVKHYLFTLFSLGLSSFFFVASRSMPTSATLFPELMAGLIAVLSIAMAVNAYKESKLTEEIDSKEENKKVDVVRVTVFLGLIALYVWLIPQVGYFIMTPLFMVVAYLYLRALGFFKAVFISLIFSAFIYGLFVKFLNLPIPMGWLEQLLS